MDTFMLEHGVRYEQSQGGHSPVLLLRTPKKVDTLNCRWALGINNNQDLYPHPKAGGATPLFTGVNSMYKALGGVQKEP